MRESTKIMLQCLDQMPKGEVINRDSKIAAPKREDMKQSMEAIIHHFKFFTEGFHDLKEKSIQPLKPLKVNLGYI